MCFIGLSADATKIAYIFSGGLSAIPGKVGLRAAPPAKIACNRYTNLEMPEITSAKLRNVGYR
jgi:hypothetical protein